MNEEILSADWMNVSATGVLERVGIPRADAAVVADALAWADVRAIAAQGLAKLPLIVARPRSGGNAASPRVRIVHEPRR